MGSGSREASQNDGPSLTGKRNDETKVGNASRLPIDQREGTYLPGAGPRPFFSRGPALVPHMRCCNSASSRRSGFDCASHCVNGFPLRAIFVSSAVISAMRYSTAPSPVGFGMNSI
jgi:hypothetical protein